MLGPLGAGCWALLEINLFPSVGISRATWLCAAHCWANVGLFFLLHGLNSWGQKSDGRGEEAGLEVWVQSWCLWFISSTSYLLEIYSLYDSTGCLIFQLSSVWILLFTERMGVGWGWEKNCCPGCLQTMEAKLGQLCGGQPARGPCCPGPEPEVHMGRAGFWDVGGLGRHLQSGQGKKGRRHALMLGGQ